ncbi:Na+/H+ antiporter subunit E [uncultured Methanocorpusculum sp.]|nr:Na+/H+ antiporter subunit E [uncultured Methanocorpusculum sp.]
MSNVFPAILAGVAVFIIYLVLSAGSATPGDGILIWSSAELVIGLILSIITGLICRKLWNGKSYRMANPLRWLLLIVYIIPFLIELIIANLTVASKIITGRNIRPGIVKLTPSMKTDGGALLLSASITYQPGTATVDVNDETRELYVHCLDAGEDAKGVMPADKIFAKINLAKWIRRITE